MTTQRLHSNQTPEQQSLDVLIALLDHRYPEENTNDLNTLRRLLFNEFELLLTHDEIINHLMIKYDEEDNRLQYKHLNISHNVK
jgi:hypothetical protein